MQRAKKRGGARTRSPKRPRTARSDPSPGASDFLQQLCRLHEQVATVFGPPLNVFLLRIVGCQAIAACSRSALAWASVAGRRVSRRLDDCRGPPYAALERFSAEHVEVMYLGRDGRADPEARIEAITKCRWAQMLLCNYGSLSGLTGKLSWGPGIYPCLGLRRVRLRGCGLVAEDFVTLLRCTPRLEAAVLLNEHLEGLGAALHPKAPRCPELALLELADCHLDVEDAAAVLGSLPALRTVHFQSMELQGLRLPQLPSLDTLRLLDCQLSRVDAADVMARCPNLQQLSLCGNPLGEAEVGESANFWPWMPKVREADFLHCELGEEDQDALRRCLAPGARLTFRASLSTLGPEHHYAPQASQHVVFSDSDSDN